MSPPILTDVLVTIEARTATGERIVVEVERDTERPTATKPDMLDLALDETAVRVRAALGALDEGPSTFGEAARAADAVEPPTRATFGGGE